DVVEAHARERAVELLRSRLLGPELPPELVCDADLVAIPAGRAEQLAEQHLGVTARDRRRARLVVVARVVEEVDSRLARRTHDLEPLFGRDALERPPRAERQDGNADPGRAERPVLDHGRDRNGMLSLRGPPRETRAAGQRPRRTRRARTSSSSASPPR